MRCKNCGWPNKPDVTNCVKCGEPLIDDGPAPMHGTTPIGNVDMPEPSNLKKTVIEAGNYGFTPQPENNTGATVILDAPDGGNTCPKCGYPLRADAVKCPNCNSSVVAPTVPIEKPVHQEPPVNHHQAKQRHTTINPYLMDMDPTPMCSLKPIKKMNERKEVPTQEYDGKEIILERGNTDPENGSITSKEQARLTNVDGVWYLEDLSEQKTTFLQLGRKTEIKDGDIILMGNRMFEFHTL